MIPLFRFAVLLPGILAACSCAMAQDAGNPGRRDLAQVVQKAMDEAQRTQDEARREAEAAVQALDADTMASLTFMSEQVGRPREIVKNAPYTAEAVSEATQVLMDGNRIVRKSVTLLARDALGRTRQEKKTDGGGTAYIYDPIENRSYVLRTARKTAVTLPRSATPPTPPAAPTPPAPPAAAVAVQPGRVIVRKGERGGSRDDVHVEVIRIGHDEVTTPDVPVSPMPPMPPLTMHGHPFPLPYGTRDKGVSEALGAREFDGIKAEGKRTTRTIPAGAIGNEKPIAIVSERWFSPELNIVVMSRDVDPRSGETVYRLTNVKRGEPPSELFKVPADYKLRGEERTPRTR
ncbi:MAG: hypothetical protein E6H78_01445 [Betaproteobacteria bacterium]|nr:MAG: hypothetical protein E6H78_01445 [Betaproteobacteria bacterium]